MNQKTILFAGAFLFASGVLAGEFFVSPSGSDNNPGSRQQPFRTAAFAAQKAQPGDMVTLLPGIHKSNIIIKNSGTAEKPIVFQGLRGKDGEYLSIIDGTAEVKNWEPAPEIAPGVWAAPCAKRPEIVTLNGMQLALVGKRRMTYPNKRPLPKEITNTHLAFANKLPYDRSKLLSGFDLMALPQDILVFHKQIDYRLKQKQPFWPVVKALAGWKDGKLYCRFGDGKFPENAVIRAGSGSGFLLKDKSYITIQDLKICGVQDSVRIEGKSASHNTVRRNCMLHGVTRVTISSGASENLVEDNFVSMGFISAGYCGSAFWKQNRLIYLLYKYIVSDRQTSGDCSIYLEQAGAGNIIRNNLLCQGLRGIVGRVCGQSEISGNFIREMSSCGIVCGQECNLIVRDNFIMDCGINLRFHYIHASPRPRNAWVFRNVLYHSGRVGMQFFFCCQHDHPDSPENIWIYHNTVLNCSPLSLRQLNRYQKKQDIRFVNNLAYAIPASAAAPAKRVRAEEKQNMPLKVFCSNFFPAEWNAFLKGPYGENHAPGKESPYAVEFQDKFPAALPSEKLQEALDLSKSFTVNGVSYPALPGMTAKHPVGARRSGEDVSRQKKMFELSEKLRIK